VDIGEVPFRDLHDYVDRTFRHVADNKRLAFGVSVAADLPRAVHTDAKRLQQVLKNLLSNAFKFTESGSVTMSIAQAADGWHTENQSLNMARSVVAFTVTDTGIGIPPEKQQIIFEAFQQADGSTNRKYGGTGLGLAISREIAGLLGGEIKLTSTPGAGSTFTLYLPQTFPAAKSLRKQGTNPPPSAYSAQDPADARPALEHAVLALQDGAAEVEPIASAALDDLGDIQPGDRVLMVVENDVNFARFLIDLAHENGFKVVLAQRGSSALKLAAQVKPHAITLDINLPDIDGWRVLNRLKDDPAQRHVPVQIITTDEDRERGLRMGAIGALTKPLKNRDVLDEAFSGIKEAIEPRVRNVLVGCADAQRHGEIAALIAGDDVRITFAASADDMLRIVQDAVFDLIVLTIDLPGRKVFDLIDDLADQPTLLTLPILVYTERELTKREETHLKRLTQTLVLRDVRSPERLIDDAALFLHRPVAALPEPHREIIAALHSPTATLAGKKVLVVDDDIRNIFAMASILEPLNMQVLTAETGKAALATLQEHPDVDVVLMDIMMPDMDGYDTMRAVRKLSRFRSLPMIALTAKAMIGDREKCIEAGASDYISKPVDTDQLLGLLRMWLYR
jgi:CheY-like chemotaxis protein